MPFIIIIILLVCFFARKRVGGKMFLLGSQRREMNFSTAPRPGVLPTESHCPGGHQLASQSPFSGQNPGITEISEVKFLFFPQCGALADSTGQGMLIL